MQKLRYYKITYFELIFLLNFLFHAVTSKLKNENRLSDIIENFISKFLGDSSIDLDTKSLIDRTLDINEIFLVKHIQPPNIVTFVKIDDIDYEFTHIAKNEKTDFLNIKNIIKIIKNFENLLFEITQQEIIILSEKLNFLLCKFLFDIEGNIEQIEINGSLIAKIINYYPEFIEFLFSKYNIKDIENFKKLNITDYYKYYINKIDDDVIIIKKDALGTSTKKFYDRFKSPDSYIKTRFQYIEEIKLYSSCKRIYQGNKKICDYCSINLKDLNSSFVMNKDLYDKIRNNDWKIFEILTYLKIRKIIGNLIPNAFISHNIQVPKKINGTEEIDILICVVEENNGVKKAIVIECKMKEKLDNGDFNQLNEHINLIRQIKNNIKVNGFIIYLGDTDNNSNAINVFDEEKIRKKIINFILQ